MFRNIHVAVDNSDYSNTSVRLGIELGRAFGSHLIGSHVYAAQLHDVRFKQMEFTLPDEYKEDTELEKQRKIHDALIARGLQLISDSYLVVMEKLCKEAELEFTPKMFDGRTFEPLVEDLEKSDYDLLILGGLGQGAVQFSTAGSVTERVLRRTQLDTLVVRDLESNVLEGEGALSVAFDGSPHAWTGIDVAVQLAEKTGRDIEIVLVEGQNTSETEEELLEAHLSLARKKARGEGRKVRMTRLDGTPADALVEHIERTHPWMVIAGRQGSDALDSDQEIGATTEALVRRSTRNVYVVGQARATSTSEVNVARDLPTEATP